MKKKDQHTERAPWEEEEKPGKKTPGNFLINREEAGENDDEDDDEDGENEDRGGKAGKGKVVKGTEAEGKEGKGNAGKAGEEKGGNGKAGKVKAGDEKKDKKKVVKGKAGDENEDEGNEDEDDAGEDDDAGTTAVRKAAKGAKKAAVKHRWQPRLSYRWIMGNVGFFLFLAALAVIYIYNGHYADKIVRDISRTNKELKELQYEYKTLRSEVMFRSKQSELAKAVEPFGLKELVQPPVIVGDSATVSR